MYTPETLRKLALTGSTSGVTMEAHADAWQARETELVEALRRIVSYADHHWTHNNVGAWQVIDAARDAIKKAEGGDGWLLSDGHRAGHG